MVALVVLQEDVVMGLVLLDEAALEEQRLVLRAGDDEVVIVHMRDHPCHLRQMVGAEPEVARDAVVQVLGLADVDDAPLRVLHQVDARGGRELRRLLPEIGQTAVLLLQDPGVHAGHLVSRAICFVRIIPAPPFPILPDSIRMPPRQGTGRHRCAAWHSIIHRTGRCGTSPRGRGRRGSRS